VGVDLATHCGADAQIDDARLGLDSWHNQRIAFQPPPVAGQEDVELLSQPAIAADGLWREDCFSNVGSAPQSVVAPADHGNNRSRLRDARRHQLLGCGVFACELRHIHPVLIVVGQPTFGRLTREECTCRERCA
jgi:hypothetical protein